MAEASPSQTVYVTWIDDTILGRQRRQLNLWGRKDQNLILQIEENLESIRHHLESIPPPSLDLNLLHEVCCCFYNHKWQRVRLVDFIRSTELTIEVFCIDSGEVNTIFWGSLRTLDIPGHEAELIRDLPPAASKFILADLSPTYGLGFFMQWSKPDVGILKMHLENRAWKVEHVGSDDGHEVVRLLDLNGEMLSMSMIKSLGSPKTSQQNFTKKVDRVLDKKAMLSTELPDFPLCVSRIAAPLVDNEETLFVVELKESGCFFGQFEKVRVQYLQDLFSEMTMSYSSNSQPHLLYADLKSHVGHYGIIRHNNNLYRVYITNEMRHDVAVSLIDFGKSERVSRDQVLAPVQGLTLFHQSPCGISCKLQDADYLKLSQLKSLFFEKTFKFKVGKLISNKYTVSLTSDPCNTAIANAISLERSEKFKSVQKEKRIKKQNDEKEEEERMEEIRFHEDDLDTYWK